MVKNNAKVDAKAIRVFIKNQIDIGARERGSAACGWR